MKIIGEQNGQTVVCYTDNPKVLENLSTQLDWFEFASTTGGTK